MTTGTYYACLTVDSAGIICTFCDSVHVLPPAPPSCNALFGHYPNSHFPDSVHFYPSSTGATHYFWSFGDGDTSNVLNPWHHYSTSGTYYACLTIDSAGTICTWCDSVHIPPPHCNANFFHYPAAHNPDSIHYYPSNTSATTYHWDFGDGDTSNMIIPWHFYNHTGTYYVCLTIDSAGIICTWCDSVHVTTPPPPPCNAQFAHYSIHNPDSVHFYPSGTASNHYYWDFGDGDTSTSQYPWHVYSTPGNYYACLTVINSAGLSCTWCDSVHVGIPLPPQCNAQFSHYYNTHNPDSVHFYISVVPTTHFTYHWNFGDGDTSSQQTPWHAYSHPGSYFVCLTLMDSVGNNCTWCDSIHVSNPPPPPCDAHFAHYSIHNPDSVHFYPTGAAANHYFWSFGDGDTSVDHYPWHLYTSSGTYFACLTIVASNGTTCTWCDSIHIGNLPPLNARFAHYSVSNPDSVHFISTTNPPGTLYDWYFGDGNTSASSSPWHLYGNPGNYFVCLNARNTNGSDSWCDSVPVNLTTGIPIMISDDGFAFVFPNPAKDFVTVAFIQINNPVTFRIYDVAGRVIFSKEDLRSGSFSVTTSGFSNGTYYYQVLENGKLSKGGKLIIIHE
jgi:PKD repeat protein